MLIEIDDEHAVIALAGKLVSSVSRHKAGTHTTDLTTRPVAAGATLQTSDEAAVRPIGPGVSDGLRRFNNILTGILNYAYFVAEAVGEGDVLPHLPRGQRPKPRARRSHRPNSGTSCFAPLVQAVNMRRPSAVTA